MVYKKDIEKLIVQNKKSNLKNHWYDALFLNTTKYSGEIKSKELLIWRSSHFLRGAYPIFHLTFDQSGKLNGIRTEKNPFHKLFDRIMIVFLIVFITSMFISIDLKTAIFGTTGVMVIGSLLKLILRQNKRYETKLITEELQKAIEKIEQFNNPETFGQPKSESEKEKVNEWTFTKVITRLLLYPFCLLILWFSINGFLKEGKYLFGVSGIAVALAYLVADILLIFRKDKNYS